LAHITKDTPNPDNGIIVRDPKTGEATGALKESAHRLVGNVIPVPNRAEKLAALRAGIKWANENGLTRVHSAGGDFEEFDLYDELLRHDEIGGPEQFRVDELVRRRLAALKDPREVSADPNARYSGAKISEKTLVPGNNARLGETRFETWLTQSAGIARAT
jgi:predicted amidohydrolase YtcJ